MMSLPQVSDPMTVVAQFDVLSRANHSISTLDGLALTNSGTEAYDIGVILSKNSIILLEHFLQFPVVVRISLLD